ncbi:MAG TPA: ABC transporter permease [Chthoniobacterales bacterium]|jgi:putative ABC transport system permease protein|nr:ABC transporter permease [Chthoniobacterales bacterium]
MNDLRYAIRQLIKSPGFTLVAVITLALGIGANSAIFSVIDTVLLRSLPFPNPDRLTMLWATSPQHPGEDKQVASYPDYLDLRAQNHTFAAIAAYTGASTIWGMGENAEDVPGIAASSDLFAVLGTPPLLGRGFSREDDKAEAARVVVIGYSFWQRRFAGDPKIIGKQVTIAGKPYTVTGVMPRGWKFPIRSENVDYIAPLLPMFSGSTPNYIMRRGAHFLPVVGRLKRGVDLRSATADLQTIAAQLAKQYPDTNAGRTARAVPLQSDLVGDVRPALLVLVAAVALVLLIACANVANLFLARAAAREREIAIRTALGASRFQIVRQLLIETSLLALLGGVAGLLLAWWSTDVLVAMGPSDIPRLNEIQVSGAVIAFTFGIAFLTSLIFGLVPALQASRPQVEQSLREASRGSTGGVRSHRLRFAFVVSQFALSLVLLVGAGLLIRSFAQLRAVKPGFEPRGVITFWQALPKARYGEVDQQTQFFDKLLAKLTALPGIEDAGIASPLPFSGNDQGRTFTIVGQPAPQQGMEPSASLLTTNGSYFRTMRIPLKRGRLFEARDNKEAKPVVLINDTFARKYFPNENPLGRLLKIGGDEEAPPREIIGVVGTAKHGNLAEADEAEFYLPFAQVPDRYSDIVVRTSPSASAGLETTIRRTVLAIDAQQFVPTITPLTQLVSQTLSQSRFNTGLLGVFASIAIILAAVGIYGVIAYNVAQRTREIGIRMALGAQRQQMLRMILRQSLTMAAIGIAVGLAGAFAATRLLRALLFGIGTMDLLTYGAVVLLLGLAAFVAGLLPARRAMKVDPVIALRYE